MRRDLILKQIKKHCGVFLTYDFKYNGEDCLYIVLMGHLDFNGSRPFFYYNFGVGKFFFSYHRFEPMVRKNCRENMRSFLYRFGRYFDVDSLLRFKNYFKLK